MPITVFIQKPAETLPGFGATRPGSIRASRSTLSTAGVVYGGLSGASIGLGMLLVPFMLGYGLTKEVFVATLAVIALTTNITRVAVFSGTNLLDERYLLLGILVGLVTIPGNWIGRSILRRMTGEDHSILIEFVDGPRRVEPVLARLARLRTTDSQRRDRWHSTTHRWFSISSNGSRANQDAMRT